MDRFEQREWASEADSAAVLALVSARVSADWPAPRLHPGDIDWWTALALGRGLALPDLVGLWWDGAGLAAFAWFQGGRDLDLLARPGLPAAAVLGDALRWTAERRAALRAGGAPEPGAIQVWAAERSTEAGAAVAAGFVAGPPRYVQHTGGLAGLDLAATALPDGIVVRTLRVEDLPSRAACGRAAFGSAMTAERYALARARPLYRADLDTVAVTPDGAVVAFALGWLDAASGAVELEPVGVDPAWHRRGLGRAVCRAALAAARRLGASRAVITAETDNAAARALYTGLGLAEAVAIGPYVRP